MSGNHSSSVFYPFEVQYFFSHIFWCALCFLLLYLSCSSFVKRVSANIDSRKKHMLDMTTKIKEKEGVLSKAKNEYQKYINDARAKCDADIDALYKRRYQELKAAVKNSKQSYRSSLGRFTLPDDVIDTESVHHLFSVITDSLLQYKK